MAREKHTQTPLNNFKNHSYVMQKQVSTFWIKEPIIFYSTLKFYFGKEWDDGMTRMISIFITKKRALIIMCQLSIIQIVN